MICNQTDFSKTLKYKTEHNSNTLATDFPHATRAKFLFSSFFIHADYLKGKTTILCMLIWKQTLMWDSFPSLCSKAESEITIWNFPEARHTSYQVVQFFFSNEVIAHAA